MKTDSATAQPDTPARIFPEIAHPDWLDESLASAIKTFQLGKADKLPQKIKGRMLYASCMQVMRCITGSDLDTAAFVRQDVLDEEQRMAALEKLSAKEIKTLLRELRTGVIE